MALAAASSVASGAAASGAAEGDACAHLHVLAGPAGPAAPELVQHVLRVHAPAHEQPGAGGARCQHAGVDAAAAAAVASAVLA